MLVDCKNSSFVLIKRILFRVDFSLTISWHTKFGSCPSRVNYILLRTPPNEIRARRKWCNNTNHHNRILIISNHNYEHFTKWNKLLSVQTSDRFRLLQCLQRFAKRRARALCANPTRPRSTRWKSEWDQSGPARTFGFLR